MIRILAAVVLAFALSGCGQATGASDSSGLLAAARQFFELDSPTPSITANTSAAPAAQGVGPIQAASQFFELDRQASSEEDGQPNLRAAGGRASHDTVAEDLEGTTEQIRKLFGDASSFLEGFPQVEDGLRNIPTRFRDQVALIRENKGKAPADVVNRRVVEMAPRAVEAIERQHDRFTSVHKTFSQRYSELTLHMSSLDRNCAGSQSHASTEHIRACTHFLDAETMVKTKVPLVEAGFAHLEDVYNEVRQYQSDLNNETLSGK